MLIASLVLAAVFSSTFAWNSEIIQRDSVAANTSQDATEPPNVNATAYPPFNATNAIGTRIYGFDGCRKEDVPVIRQAYDDFRTLSNTKGVLSDIDWNGAAALEFLGPPAFNERQREQIQAVFANAATVYPGSFFNPFKHFIRVRCDDPRKRCPESNDGKDPCRPNPIGSVGDPNGSPATLNAYSLNKDPDDPRWPMISFCRRFFEKKVRLEKGYATGSHSVGNQKYNISNYANQAETMFHELLHLNLVADSEGGRPNPIVDDLHITFSYRDEDDLERHQTDPAYGALRTKLLARFKPERFDDKTGSYVQQNADNLVWFAMAKYVEGRLGVYPHIPVITEYQLVGPPFKKPNPFVEYTMRNNQPLLLSNVPYLEPVYPCNDRLDDDTTSTNLTVTLGAPYEDSDYPADYIAQRSSWVAEEAVTPLAGQLAPPRCQSEVLTDAIHGVSREEAVQVIDNFCGEYWWQMDIIPAVTLGDGQPHKQIEVNGSFPVNHADDDLHLVVSWKPGCMGSQAFTVGATDAEKKSHCATRFLTILDGCDTNSTNPKYGGGLVDGCLVYRLGAVASKAADPFPVFAGGPAFACTDGDASVDPSFANACMCYYTGQPETRAAFDKPEGGCAKLTAPPATTFHNGTTATTG